MSALNIIRQVLKRMSKEEHKVARSYLTALSTRGENGPNKSLKLFDLVAEELHTGKELTEREMELFVYGKSAQAAFLRLVFRLKDKLLESLVLATNIEREGAYSERAKVLHQLRRELSKAQILQDRGMRDLAASILNDVINKAIRYEHFEECVAAMRVRMQILVLNVGSKSVSDDKEKYEKAIQSLLAVRKGYEYYTMLIGETEFKSAPGVPYFSQKLQEQVDELYAALKTTGSANVAFYLNYIEAHHLQLQCRYKAAAKVLKEQVTIVEQHPAINSNARLAGAIINYGWNEICVYRFENAIQEIEKAEALLPASHFNMYQCYETKFYAHFYLGEYKKAIHYLDLLKTADSGPTAEYRTGKREYRRACVAFVMKDYETTHTILREMNPVEEDSQGWNIGIRFLHILNDIETDKIENAVLRIENLRKHLDKLKKKTEITRRDWIKFEILRDLVNTRFNFTETHTRRKTELELLNSNDPMLNWRILSPELIPFNQWFASRLLKTDFKIKIQHYEEPMVMR